MIGEVQGGEESSEDEEAPSVIGEVQGGEESSEDEADVRESEACQTEGLKAEEGLSAVGEGVQDGEEPSKDVRDSEADQMEGLKIEEGAEEPQALRGGQEQAKMTYTESFVLNIFDQDVIQRLRDMDPDELLAVAHRALNEDPTLPENALGVRWLSGAIQMESGDMKVFVHAENPEDLEFLAQNTTWARALEHCEAALVESYEVMIRGVRVTSMNLDHFDSKAMVIDRVAGLNSRGATSLNRPDDIRDIRWQKPATLQKRSASAIINFVTLEHANYALENGLYWDGIDHECEIMGANYRLRRCKNCQTYGHEPDVCSGPLRCGNCSESHLNKDCKSTTRTCPVCSGPHSVWSEKCPAHQNR